MHIGMEKLIHTSLNWLDASFDVYETVHPKYLVIVSMTIAE